MTFYTLFILSTNTINEFCVDRKVCVTLESAYRTGQSILKEGNIHGYVITKHTQDSWSVVTQYAPGVDYTVFEKNGRVDIHEGRQKIVMV